MMMIVGFVGQPSFDREPKLLESEHSFGSIKIATCSAVRHRATYVHNVAMDGTRVFRPGMTQKIIDWDVKSAK